MADDLANRIQRLEAEVLALRMLMPTDTEDSTQHVSEDSGVFDSLTAAREGNLVDQPPCIRFLPSPNTAPPNTVDIATGSWWTREGGELTASATGIGSPTATYIVATLSASRAALSIEAQAAAPTKAQLGYKRLLSKLIYVGNTLDTIECHQLGDIGADNAGIDSEQAALLSESIGRNPNNGDLELYGIRDAPGLVTLVQDDIGEGTNQYLFVVRYLDSNSIPHVRYVKLTLATSFYDLTDTDMTNVANADLIVHKDGVYYPLRVENRWSWTLDTQPTPFETDQPTEDAPLLLPGAVWYTMVRIDLTTTPPTWINENWQMCQPSGL